MNQLPLHVQHMTYMCLEQLFLNKGALNSLRSYLAQNLTSHHFPKFRYKPILNSQGGRWKSILYTTKLYFYSVIYSTHFGSRLCSRNIVYKYLFHMVNNSIQIYSVYNHISLIDLCLNYDYQNGIQFQGSKQGLTEESTLYIYFLNLVVSF